ncbi:MAG: hypothetical protein EA396_01765 [Anaerolineaceae bacterium]|nr:MAG: hypothetical protein EA396_01765 [Anaerolineaceae bacterium]
MLGLWITLLLLLGDAPPICPTENPPPGTHQHTLISDDILRDYTLYIPPNIAEDTPAPLIVALHGLGDTVENFMQLSDWAAIADRDGAILVFPAGFRGRWHVNVFGRNDIDDVLFLHDLLDELAALTCYDAARVFINGFSNGGGMAERFACSAPERVAAVGIVGGAVEANFDACAADVAASAPVPLIAIHGLRDSIVPYRGINVDGLRLPDIGRWIESWAARNDCEPSPQIQTISAQIERTIYTDCAADVLLYTVADGRHEWYGGQQTARVVRPPNDAIDASETLWGFAREQFAVIDTAAP